MGVDIHKTETRCSQLNRDNACAIISCIIEMNFVHTMLDLLIENQVNTTNVHSLGFDPSDSCKSTGLLPHEMEGYVEECCGEYPHRFTFNVQGGDRACCNGATYST